MSLNNGDITRIVSWNVRGLNHPVKRGKIMAFTLGQSNFASELFKYFFNLLKSCASHFLFMHFSTLFSQLFSPQPCSLMPFHVELRGYNLLFLYKGTNNSVV